MTKMIAIYKTPKDTAAFDAHYFNVHIPLSHQLPGLRKYEMNDGPVSSTTGHNDIYRIAVLHFDSMEAMMAAFMSDIGKQCAADRRLLAADGQVQIYYFDTQDTSNLHHDTNRNRR